MFLKNYAIDYKFFLFNFIKCKFGVQTDMCFKSKNLNNRLSMKQIYILKLNK